MEPDNLIFLIAEIDLFNCWIQGFLSSIVEKYTVIVIICCYYYCLFIVSLFWFVRERKKKERKKKKKKERKKKGETCRWRTLGVLEN